MLEAAETARLQSRVLDLLFPNLDCRDLVDKSRSELISQLSPESSTDKASSSGNPPRLRVVTPSPPLLSGNLEDDLDEPEEPESDVDESEEQRHWDEPAQNPATIGPSDDINAVSVAGDRHHRSYLGICSVNAALKTLFRFCPAAKANLVEQSTVWLGAPQEDGQQALPVPHPVVATTIDSWRDMRHIGFYFESIHGITPFLHEESFKATFASGDHHTPTWLGLCNMVLAMGSIASGNDNAHIHYYNKARSYLDLESLGSGNLETLQTLCVLGGYYLQYRNSPNMAYAVLGAAQRLALVLGLHREAGCREENLLCTVQAEIRRRTWWSLYCLDTWASMTLGRPTCGRWDWNTMDTSPPAALDAHDHFATSLQACVQFCHLSNHLQDRFAQRTRIGAQEARCFDDELQQFHRSLPKILTDTPNVSPRMAVAISFLRNRYQNVRLMLSRCILIYIAYENPRRLDISEAEGQMVDLCRSIAAEAIDSIAMHWAPNRTQTWNSTWYLFQACMVPLLSIAMASSTGPLPVSSETIMTWRSSLEKAQQVFKEMKPWMRPEDRIPDVVDALVHSVSQEQSGCTPAPSLSEGEPQFSAWSDQFSAEVDWSLFLNEDNLFQSFA